jgi:hypothetical protein
MAVIMYVTVASDEDADADAWFQALRSTWSASWVNCLPESFSTCFFVDMTGQPSQFPSRSFWNPAPISQWCRHHHPRQLLMSSTSSYRLEVSRCGRRVFAQTWWACSHYLLPFMSETRCMPPTHEAVLACRWPSRLARRRKRE